MFFNASFFILYLISTFSLYSMYDIQKSFWENVATSTYDIPCPSFERKPKAAWIHFLGYTIASPIGIPACPIMTSKGIEVAARLGFDVLTYKTIRVLSCTSHPWPNIVYIDYPYFLSIDHIGDKIKVRYDAPKEIAIANSFGNPSFDLEYIRADIKKSKQALQEGQVLIVSVFGESIDEFTYAACLAREAGADIIEANFSCPNLLIDQPPIFLQPYLVHQYCHALVDAVDCPVIMKVGAYKDKDLLKHIMKIAAQAGVQGITGINSVPMQIIDEQGNPFFGHERLISGVSGQPIRHLALDFVKTAYEIIKQEHLDMIILATGGITHPEHFINFLDAGARVAMSATGMMWHPTLAAEFHQRYGIRNAGKNLR